MERRLLSYRDGCRPFQTTSGPALAPFSPLPSKVLHLFLRIKAFHRLTDYGMDFLPRSQHSHLRFPMAIRVRSEKVEFPLVFHQEAFWPWPHHVALQFLNYPNLLVPFPFFANSTYCRRVSTRKPEVGCCVLLLGLIVRKINGNSLEPANLTKHVIVETVTWTTCGRSEPTMQDYVEEPEPWETLR